MAVNEQRLNEVCTYLGNQFRRATPILFTGSGFSHDARAINGELLPVGPELTKALWDLTFPGEEMPDNTRLQDAYQAAMLTQRTATVSLIREHLTVDSTKLPSYYARYFQAPWSKAYTLNLDNLVIAVASRFTLQRRVAPWSGTSDQKLGPGRASDLQLVHLNGSVTEEPQHWTFSDLDYGSRSARPDAAYLACASDVMSRPIVYVGTDLNESPLWHFVQLRASKGARGVRELRPQSYLVCPTLNAAKRQVLSSFNVEWLPMTAEEFSSVVLKRVSSTFEEGLKVLSQSMAALTSNAKPLLLVNLSPTELNRPTEFLIGQEPDWSDIHMGRAIRRECDLRLLQHARSVLSGAAQSQTIIVTGTAGSGKSTSLRRLALELSATGIDTYWVDHELNISPSELSKLVRESREPVCLILDDIDLWGQLGTTWASDVPRIRERVLLVAGVRSGRYERLRDSIESANGAPKVHFMPHLTDSDIEGLIAVLDGNNRLGRLKGMSHQARVREFRQQAGRQLLVAMIRATSGDELYVKIRDEFDELPQLAQTLYAILCVSTSNRFNLQRQDLLTAVNQSDNEALNAIDQLVNTHIVTRRSLHDGYRARHRMIADEVVTHLREQGKIKEPLISLAFGSASAVRQDMPYYAMPMRRLRRFITHDYLIQMMAVDDVRELYAMLEPLVNWSYHFWLQRGSVEVEEGSLGLAENFIGQARSMADNDWLVETEWAYLQIKRAYSSPQDQYAQERYDEGESILMSIINTRGKIDPYPYHVLGSQGLAWCRRTSMSTELRRDTLKALLERVNDGCMNHSSANDLRQLRDDLRREWLMTAVGQPPVDGVQSNLPGIDDSQA